MWAAAVDSDGRTYFYNTSTNEVQWTNPWKTMLLNTQEFVEDILDVAKTRRVLSCLHIGLTFRLRRMMDRWVDVVSSTRVQTMCATLDAWMQMKQTLLFVLQKRDDMLEQLVIYKLKCTELEDELAHTKVRQASLEFERMSRHAKASTSIGP